MSNDAEPTTRSLSVPCGQSLALRSGNALVTRGLKDIAQFSNRARAEELVKLGGQCRMKEEYNDAITHFSEAIRLIPNYAEAYYRRAVVHMRREDYDSAI